MLNDLITRYKSGTIKKDQLVVMLGAADRWDSGYLFYTVTQERFGYWPLHTKSLVLKLSRDSTVEWLRIHE